MHLLRLYGLAVQTDWLPVPLSWLPGAQGPADVTIATGEVATSPWPQAVAGENGAEVLPDRLRFTVQDVARYEVREGRQIIYQSLGDQPDRMRLFLLGPAMAALVLQRGWLALHGNLVDLRGQRLAILGEPEAGKSSLTAALCQAGGRFVSDDLLPIAPDLTTALGPPWLRLRAPALAPLGLAADDLPLVRPNGRKRILRMSEQDSPAPRPIDQVIILGRSQDADQGQPSLARLSGLQAFAALGGQSYRPSFEAAEGGQRRLLLRLAEATPVWRLSRPQGPNTLQATVDLIAGGS